MKHKYLIKDSQTFEERLINKYSKNIINDFDDLFTRQFWNLVDLTRKYGFSRERASQIFRNLYGHGYRQIGVEKTAERNQERNLCSLHFPPRFRSLLLELEKRQMQMERVFEQKFKINSHVVRFYRASAIDYSRYGGKHFRAVLWHDDFDFGIVEGKDSFYIVPRDEFHFEQSLQRFVLYIRASPYASSGKSRCGIKPKDIEKYRNAWHLLR